MALRRKTRRKSSSKAANSSADTGTSSGSATGGKSTRKSTKSAKAAGSSGMVAVLSDPKALRRMLLAAKIIGPAVAAGALRTSTGVRGALDERRARQLGVPVEDVAAYRGPAGVAQARISGLRVALNDLRARRGTDPTVAVFVDRTTARLGELSAAATATASMPPPTRRSALRAVSADLDDIDEQLMSYLVGPRTG